MDYEKAYKEALERAKYLKKNTDSVGALDISTCFEEIFPELRESDDDRIIKKIMLAISQTVWTDYDKNECISWLEKQGEKTIPKNIDDAALQYVDNCAVDGEVTHNNITEPYWNNHSIMAAYKAGWLEKQCSISNINEKLRQYREYLIKETERWYKKLEDEILSKIGKQDCIGHANAYVSARSEFEDLFNYDSWLEKQGEPTDKIVNEQNPINKVEPKFNAGDWIINNDKRIAVPTQVLEIEKYGYVTSRGYISFDKVKTDYHLWTIEDAEDGDVLFFNDGHGNDSIELIKSITGKKIEFWFCLTNGSYYEVFDGIIPYTNLVSREGATPATKEQRDLLFQKMKEEGYEFDFDKLEFKKIERKPAWNEKIKGRNELETYILSLVLNRPLDAIKVDAKNIRYIINKEQNPAWSEEDKNVEKISEYTTVEKDMDEYNKGFECGKQRVLKYPEDFNLCEKSASAWNEEDEKKRKSLIKGLEDRMGFGWASDPFSREEYIDWLKSLKERMKGK